MVIGVPQIWEGVSGMSGSRSIRYSSMMVTQSAGQCWDDVALFQEGPAGDAGRYVAGVDLLRRVAFLVVEHAAAGDDLGVLVAAHDGSNACRRLFWTGEDDVVPQVP